MGSLLPLLLPAAAAGFDIYWDGVTPTHVPRTVRSQPGYVAEFLHVFEPSPHIRINASHAAIKIAQTVRASFAATNVMGKSYSGVSAIRIINTPMSVFAGTMGGWGEKSHVLRHAGIWPNASAVRADAERNAQDASTRAHARAIAPYRINQVAKHTTTGGPHSLAKQIFNAGVDLHAVGVVRDFVNATAASGSGPPARPNSALSDLRLRAQAAWAGRATLPSLRNDLDCQHFDEAPGERAPRPLPKQALPCAHARPHEPTGMGFIDVPPSTHKHPNATP